MAAHQFATPSGPRGFVGVVSQPGNFSLVEMGWVFTGGRSCPVRQVDLQPWRLGEAGRDPAQYGFRFQAGDEWYSVQVSLVSPVRGEAWYGSAGQPREARVVERCCSYTVNGEPGWGVSEWQFSAQVSQQ